eukprot:2384501-Pyramimonas_sp.AAC.1
MLFSLGQPVPTWQACSLQYNASAAGRFPQHACYAKVHVNKDSVAIFQAPLTYGCGPTTCRTAA